jgi:hypothetical protein
LGYTLGDFFENSSGHPVRKSKVRQLIACTKRRTGNIHRMPEKAREIIPVSVQGQPGKIK